jgi:hypothetical protein
MVVDAVITAEGANEMNTTITEENETAQAGTPTDQPKATKKARVAQHRAHVAPSKAKAAKKASPAKKGTKAAKGAKAGNKATGTREGSKTAKILDLLKRPGGSTLKDLMKASGWQSHSVRGFLSILGKKKGLAVESTKSAAGERTYSIKS